MKRLRRKELSMIKRNNDKLNNIPGSRKIYLEVASNKMVYPHLLGPEVVLANALKMDLLCPVTQ